MKTTGTLIVVALLAACDSEPEAQRGDTQQRLTNQAMAVGQEAMKPVGKAATDAMQAHLDSIQKREQERKEKLAAAREAATPKIYRWKDREGVWQISDTPPPEGTTAEVVPIAPGLR
jgi:predicted lipoprotein